jgi:hypothetical protein
MHVYTQQLLELYCTCFIYDVREKMPGKKLVRIGIFTTNQLLQSGIGILAPLVMDESCIAQL